MRFKHIKIERAWRIVLGFAVAWVCGVCQKVLPTVQIVCGSGLARF